MSTAPETMQPAETSTGRVLLAEDNAVNQQVAVAMLKHLGFEVDVVCDGAEAVRAATAATAYEAVFMDCQIPVLDGYQATAEIRRLQGGARRTPIIAITASASAADQRRCLAAGMDGYLAKPLSLKSLTAALVPWTRLAADAPVDDGPADLVRPAPAALDPRVVARLQRLGDAAGEDLLARLAVLFLADADGRVVAMRQALATGDSASVVMAAHTLSGASANLGASDLARLCAALATGSAAGDLADGGLLLDEVDEELGRVRSALGTLIAAAS